MGKLSMIISHAKLQQLPLQQQNAGGENSSGPKLTARINQCTVPTTQVTRTSRNVPFDEAQACVSHIDTQVGGRKALTTATITTELTK
jgi:hypothetical protein